MDDQQNDKLESWGQSATPKVDGAFANRLEADLRELAHNPAPGRFSTGWLLRPGVIMTAVVLVVGAIFIARSDSDRGVQMVSAAGTTVSIPGAASVQDGTAGLDLPDGTRISVGPEGLAVVAGVVLEAGSTATITDGRVDVIEAGSPVDEPTTDTRPDTPPDRTAPTTTEPTPGTDRLSTTTTVTPDRATDAPTTTAVDRPSDSTTSTIVSDSTSSSAPEPETTVAPTTTTTTTEPPTTAPTDPPVVDTAPLEIGLEIGPVRDGRATLRWTVEGDGSEIVGWVVRIRRGDSSEVVTVIRQPDVRRLRVVIPNRNVQYRVIARGADGEVLATSRLISP